MTNVDPTQVDPSAAGPASNMFTAAASAPPAVFGGSGAAMDANTSHRLQLIMSSAPIFNNSPTGIQAATQMAQSTMSDQDIVSTAKSQAAMMMTDSMKTQLDQETDPGKKWQLWHSLDDTQQKMLKQSGYTAPAKVDPTPDTSPWGITKGIVGGLFQDVADVAKLPGISTALKVAGTPLSTVQHLARAGILGVEEEGLFGIGGTISDAEKQQRRGSLGGILSDAEDLWDRTGNGEKTFSAKSMDRVNQSMGDDPDKVNFVRAMASGESVDDFLTKDMKMSSTDPNYTDQVNKFNEYLGDQKIQDTITDLKNNKLSVGRLIASRVASRGSLAFNAISGGLDATFDVVGDPTLWAGNAFGEYRTASRAIMGFEDFSKSKFAVNLADSEAKAAYSEYVAHRVQYLADNVPKFNQGMDNIAQRLTEGNPDVLMDEMPSVRKGINSMTQYFYKNGLADVPYLAGDMTGVPVTRENVIQYFKDTAQSGELFNGNFSVPHFDGVSLPSFGRMQQLKSGLIATGKEAIEGFRLADLGLDGMTRDQLQQLYAGMGKSTKWATLAQAQNGVGEFLKSLVTKVPTKDYMDPFDSAAPQNFRAMMSFTLPPSMQKGYLDDFLKAGTYEGRRAVYTSALDAMWQYSGAAMTDEGKQIYQKVTQGDQVYMANAMDRLNGVPAGVLESDAARRWAIPDFPSMLKATSDVTTARRLLDETNDGLISKFMNVWRPAVLMRVGFIPRSYGEEMLTFMQREGLGAYVKSQAALAAVNPDEAWFTKPVNWVADSMLKHVPYAGDMAQAMTHHMTSYADSFFKNFSEKIAGDQLTEAARNIMANNKAILNSATREWGSYHGMAAEDLGARSRRELIYKQDANGDIVPANITFGQITSHMRGDAFYHHTVYREMMRVADSELARPVMDAMTRSMGLEEGTNLQNLFNDSGFLPQRERTPMVQGPKMLEGMNEEQYVANKAQAPFRLTQDNIIPQEASYDTSHPNVKMVAADENRSVYHYHDEEGNVMGQLTAYHPHITADLDAQGKVNYSVHQPESTVHLAPGVDQGVANDLVQTARNEDYGFQEYPGYNKTEVGAREEFQRKGLSEMLPGEPEPVEDLNYGHALLRARQQIPPQVMPEFEHYLQNTASVGTKTVVKTLVDAGMDPTQADILVNDVIPQMSPRQRYAIFTQDGVMERNLQAKMLDPNQEFDMASIPGYTSDRYYHGSFQLPEDGKLRPIHYDEGNLYGPGFYTTEDPGVATEYTHKTRGAGGDLDEENKRPGIFQMGWQGNKPPNLLNLDQKAVDAPQHITDMLENNFGVDVGDLWDRAEGVAKMRLSDSGYDAEEFTRDKEPEDYVTLGDLIETLARGEHYLAPAEMVHDNAKQFIDELQRQGYDGYTHIGGGRVGDKPHKVSIFFDTSKVGVLKAPGMKSVADFLPAVRQGAADEAQRAYERNLLDLWSEGGSTRSIGTQLAGDRLSNGDMGEYVNLMRRGSEVEGDKVASVPAHGMRRLYTVVGPPEVAMGPNSPLRFAPLGGVFDAKEGWVPIAHGDVSQLFDTEGVEHNLPTDGNAWFSTDHHEATDIQQKLLRYQVGESPYSGAAQLHVAYVDVPESVAREGQAAAQAAGGGGLDPLAKARQGNAVWLPKSFRQDYQALGDDYQLLEPPVAPGHARLYRLDSAEEAEKAKQYDSGVSYTSSRDLAEARLPFEEQNVHYIDVPSNQADARRVTDATGRDRFVFKPSEATSQELTTYPSTGVDQKAALQNWGYNVSAKVHQVFGGNGALDETLQDIVHNALHDNLRLDHLWVLKTTQLPDETLGPQILVNDPQSALNRITRHGFDAITQAGDAMIRSPMFLWNYSKNLPTIRALVEHNLGDPEANQVINLVADHLGYDRGKVLSAWHSLPDEIKQAVNPMEAAIARDPIPPNLRLLQSQEDLQKLANAGDSIYHLKDGELADNIREEIQKNKIGIRGAFPSIDPNAEKPSLDDLLDSYLGLPEKVRTNIAQNGLPQVFPEELMGKEMPLSSDQWTAFRGAVDKNKHIEETIDQLAQQRAINDTIPWIHNHHLRSQFQEHMRNFIPFWFAQENFIGRAANLMARDPNIIRQAQQTVHGLQTFGAITKNQYGEDVYNIPFTGALMRMLSAGADLFGKYSIPINDPMTGQLKYTLPGIDELTNIAPSFSPVAALPMQAISGLIPELKPMSDFVSGSRGSKQNLSFESMMKQITPSYLYNIWEGIAADPNTDLNMVSNQIQTAQRLEAAGHGIPQAQAGSMDVPSEQMQDYLDRLKNHSRLAMMVKGVLGFFSPVSPDINPKENFTPEFQAMLRNMPLNDALTAFTAQHPNALPYTVMKTKVTSGAPLPSTPDALAMMDQNPEFFNKYKSAGAWFLPQSTVQDQFAQDAYNQQLAMNLRVNKSVVDWYRDYYFASASKDYFDTKAGYDQRYAAAKGNPQLRQQMTDQYNAWKQTYFKQNPVFAEEIQSPEGKQRRQRILDELPQALADPVAKQSPQAQQLSDMLDTYNGAKDRLALYPRSDQASSMMKQAIKDQFSAWAKNYAFDHPQVNAFYTRVIEPETSTW